MDEFNVNLCNACIDMFLKKKLRMQAIAKLADISNSRFSKILNGKLKIKVEEKRKLSKVLGKAQKDLF